jgi:PAS domain-containing protein
MQDSPSSPSASPAPAAPPSLDDLCRACIDSSPYGIRVVEPDGRIALFNRSLERITGYCAQEIPDMATWLAKLYPDPAYRERSSGPVAI